MFVKFDGSLWWANDADKKAVKLLQWFKDIPKRKAKSKKLGLYLLRMTVLTAALSGIVMLINRDAPLPLVVGICGIVVGVGDLTLAILHVLGNVWRLKRLGKQGRARELPDDFIEACQDFICRKFKEEEVNFLFHEFPEQMDFFTEALEQYHNQLTSWESKRELEQGIRRTFEPLIVQALDRQTTFDVESQTERNRKLLRTVDQYPELDNPNEQ